VPRKRPRRSSAVTDLIARSLQVERWGRKRLVANASQPTVRSLTDALGRAPKTKATVQIAVSTDLAEFISDFWLEFGRLVYEPQGARSPFATSQDLSPQLPDRQPLLRCRRRRGWSLLFFIDSVAWLQHLASHHRPARDHIEIAVAYVYILRRDEEVFDRACPYVRPDRRCQLTSRLIPSMTRISRDQRLFAADMTIHRQLRARPDDGGRPLSAITFASLVPTSRQHKISNFPAPAFSAQAPRSPRPIQPSIARYITGPLAHGGVVDLAPSEAYPPDSCLGCRSARRCGNRRIARTSSRYLRAPSRTRSTPRLTPPLLPIREPAIPTGAITYRRTSEHPTAAD
jgi:hypothetical protein